MLEVSEDARCRLCHAPLERTFVDLGLSPPSNSYVRLENAVRGEYFFPLHAYVCERCFLVQLRQYQEPQDIFGEYAYLSSYSDSWLAHCKTFADQISGALRLDERSFVVEAASNDGYLLQYFAGRGIPVLGIEPAANVAEIARGRGIRTETAFLGEKTGQALAGSYGRADLIVANNVIAHVPQLHDFVSGLIALLAEDGTLTVECPHLLQLIQKNQYDTIYHEHFSYFSLHTLERLFAKHDCRIIHVEELETHGGSIRVWVAHQENSREQQPSVSDLLRREEVCGLTRIETFANFEKHVRIARNQLLRFLMERAEAADQVVAYGAPAKGNTMLNYCGIRQDLLRYAVDRNPLKQGTLLPGSRIPVFAPEHIEKTKPEYVVILPWNLAEEIKEQLAYIRTWGGRFVVAIPELTID